MTIPNELRTLIRESIRFSSWAAAQGLMPADGEDAQEPADFLMAYSNATDFEDWDDLAEHVDAVLSGEQT